MIQLTKKEAVRMFMDMYNQDLSKSDKIANREAWNNWTDMYCKAGRITEHQFNTWQYPRNKFFY